LQHQLWSCSKGILEHYPGPARNTYLGVWTEGDATYQGDQRSQITLKFVQAVNEEAELDRRVLLFKQKSEGLLKIVPTPASAVIAGKRQ
jgi:hypothetical protein